jgi:hypothetical protein
MTSIRGVALACATTALLALPVVARAQSGMTNQDTFFTFSQPVELPNATLPAGTYLFRLADTAGNRHIVRVMSQDRRKLFTTLLAIPAYSLERPPQKPEIRFMESPATKANAIKIWFYPGNPVGHEFIYPRNQAIKLAKASGEPVLTTKADEDVSTTVADNDLTRVNPEGQDTAANMSSQRASANARSETGSIEAAGSTASSSASSSTQTANDSSASAARNRQGGTAGATGTSGNANAATRTRRSLPRTAGMLPLFGLIGLGALAGSRLIRRVRRA